MAVQLVRFKYGSDAVVVDKWGLQTRLGGDDRGSRKLKV